MLYTLVASNASSGLMGGRIDGSERANSVLSLPGGPLMSRLWPPAAATSSARLAYSWPRTSARSTPSTATGAAAAPFSGRW